MKLSLCIATFNEEKFLHYPLDSATDLVDEVIIVDGRSSDKTVEVAKSYGKKVKVIVTDNPPIFHINKQKAIEKARGEWILQLDADEALSPELREEIQSVIVSETKQSKQNKIAGSSATPRNDDSKHVAYWLPRKNFFLGRFLTKGGQYPDYTIRLYKRGVAHFPCKNVHENVVVKGEVGYLKNDLLHYADPDFGRYLMRWNRYTTLDAQELVKNNKNPGFISYIILKPIFWFLRAFIRYRGFMDGFPGFVFALFSSIRFWAIYAKAWQLRRENLKVRPL